MYRTPLLFAAYLCCTEVYGAKHNGIFNGCYLICQWLFRNATARQLHIARFSFFQRFYVPVSPFFVSIASFCESIRPIFCAYIYVSLRWDNCIWCTNLLNAAPYTTLGITVEPICKIIISLAFHIKVDIPCEGHIRTMIDDYYIPCLRNNNRPTGPAIATPAIDTPRQAVNNARFNIDCFIDILSFLYYSDIIR